MLARRCCIEQSLLVVAHFFATMGAMGTTMECCRARHEKDDVIMVNGQVIELEKAPRYRERDAVVDYQVAQALQDGDMMSMDEIFQISSHDHPVRRAVQRDHVMLSARFDKEAGRGFASSF